MKHTRTRQVIHAEKLIESTMSTLINGSMALRFQPFNPSAWASPSGSGQNHQNHTNTGWNRPQPSRPQNNWQTAQNDWQRPSHSHDNRPQPTRPQNAWRPAQNDWQRPQPTDSLPLPGGTRPNQEQCSVRPPQWVRSDQTDSTSSFNQYGPRTRQ